MRTLALEMKKGSSRQISGGFRRGVKRHKPVCVDANKALLRSAADDLGPVVDGDTAPGFPGADGLHRRACGTRNLTNAPKGVDQRWHVGWGGGFDWHVGSLHIAEQSSTPEISDLQIVDPHSGGMKEFDETTAAGRLASARARRGYRTAKAASEAMGVPYGTYSGHEAGSRGFSDEDAARYATFFRVPVEWIVFGKGSATESNIVPVVGKISAGNSIDVAVEDVSHTEPLYEIHVDMLVPHDAFALEVAGESMWPRYDSGDVLICYRRSQEPDSLVGMEAAIATADGNRYLKILHRGSEPGLYTLTSHNAAPITNVKIHWVSEIRYVVRATRWRKLDSAGRRRVIKGTPTK